MSREGHALSSPILNQKILLIGKYNKRQSGYSNVVRFPKGAASIKVVQKGFRTHDGNYLALVDSGNNYLLNGDITLTNVKTDVQANGKLTSFTLPFAESQLAYLFF